MEATPAPPPGAVQSGRQWVKLCETPATAAKDFFGRAGVVGVKTCLTYHERLDPTNGALVVAVGLRQAGQRQTLTIMVPKPVQQVPSARIYIYPSGLWERVLRREKIDKSEVGRVGSVNLKYAFCHAEACTAEAAANPELVKDLKSNAGLVLFVMRDRRPIAFALALGGFREVNEGPPTDSAAFYKAREELLRKIRERLKPRVQPPPQPPRLAPGERQT
jgi:invasion protein IalB